MNEKDEERYRKALEDEIDYWLNYRRRFEDEYRLEKGAIDDTITVLEKQKKERDEV